MRVRIHARLAGINGKAPSRNSIEASVRQCAADAVEGSFDGYPEHLKKLLTLRGEVVGDIDVADRTATDVGVDFELSLPEELFPVEHGGLQTVVDLLAGDLIPTESHGCQWRDARVLSVDLSDAMKRRATRAFRATAHTVAQVRQTFKLPPGRPLLAFTFKPRVGLGIEDTKRITLEVLSAGFNLVELDARNLSVRDGDLDRWLDLGIEAAQIGGSSRVTAFSPNLSLPEAQMLEIAHAWTEGLKGYGPPVVKIDGGLDGLSNLQALRSVPGGADQPIITCYPTLRRQLSSAIGADTWVELLALSGADILYPGGRPTFPHEQRAIWGSEADGWRESARKYDALLARGWPMPTVAGGVHPGHLHALYELLGPSVAYFLGGAVALHPKSVAEGAKLCVEVLENAVHLADTARDRGDYRAEDLPAKLLGRLEKARYPVKALHYFSPSIVFHEDERDSPPPQTFYSR